MTVTPDLVRALVGVVLLAALATLVLAAGSITAVLVASWMSDVRTKPVALR